MIGGLVLAGGLSTRMGMRKSFITLNGDPLISIIVRNLTKIVDEVVVAVGFKDDPSAHVSVLPASTRVVKDKVEGQSPLIGILTGLSEMSSTYAAILPCDLPFAKAQVIGHLFKRADGFDAAIPRWPDGGIEPLHAIYRVDAALGATRIAVSSGGVKNTDMIERLTRINYIAINEIRQFDPQLLSFFNINTPQDLMIAKKIASEYFLREQQF